MTWFVNGNSDSLTLGISESGYREILGNSIKHKVQKSLSSFPSSHEIAQKELFEKLSGLEFLWGIHPTNAVGEDIINDDETLYDRCKSSPESSFVSFSYYDFEDDPESPIKDRVKSIGVSIILPPATFDKVWELFNTVFLEPSLYYCIVIDFWGFKVEGASTETPTINEFLNGKLYYSNEVSFSIGRKIRTFNANENDIEHR